MEMIKKIAGIAAVIIAFLAVFSVLYVAYRLFWYGILFVGSMIYCMDIPAFTLI